MLNEVKKDGADYKWSPEQIEELQKCITDKIYFFEKYLKVKSPHHGFVPVKLNRSQLKIHKNHEAHDKTMCVGPRQIGGSTYVMMEIIHGLLFYNHQTTVIGTYKLNASKDIIRAIQEMISRLPDCLSSTVIKSNKTEIKTLGGSRLMVQAINSDFCRGMGVSNIYFDNVSTVAEKSLSDLYDVLGPVLDVGNKKIRFIDSAPLDYFNKMWQFVAREDFVKFNIKLEDDERFDDPAYKETLKEQIGNKAYIQEYEQPWVFK